MSEVKPGNDEGGFSGHQAGVGNSNSGKMEQEESQRGAQDFFGLDRANELPYNKAAKEAKEFLDQNKKMTPQYPPTPDIPLKAPPGIFAEGSPKSPDPSFKLKLPQPPPLKSK